MLTVSVHSVSLYRVRKPSLLAAAAVAVAVAAAAVAVAAAAADAFDAAAAAAQGGAPGEEESLKALRET